MSEQHMRYWTKLATPPPSALKRITAGRLQGMTDIKPQWRLEIMTEVFGPCGIGWRYTIDRTWTETAANDEVLAFVSVSVFVRIDDGWSQPVPGIGGNKLIAAESRGPHSNDEAFKMALTDALSVAFRALGVAADIYSGLWDGTKYHRRPESAITKQELNKLKVEFADRHKDELEQLERPEQLQRFSLWCKTQCGGEYVDYDDPGAWSREWLDACLHALKNGETSP